MNIHELRKDFWEMRNNRALNSGGVYVDTLHAELDVDGETLIGAEIWHGRKKVKVFPANFRSRLYK